MKKYQIWSFCFIEQNINIRFNVLNGTNEESDYEVEIPCFDGLSYFKIERNGITHYYRMAYPKINKLNSYHKSEIEDYCGYIPEKGEYGVICGALGVCIETDKATFEACLNLHPLPKKVIKRLGW